MPLELRQLRHVLALAQHGSLGRAAATLHMTQPALSRSLKVIERDVGASLFVRSGSGVTPTDHGLLLVLRARELVDAAEDLEREVLRRRVGGSGQLSIGAGAIPSETVMPTALAQFVAAHPLVRVRVLARGDWDELLKRLRARELDFYVAEFSTLGAEHDLDIEPLDRHQMYFVARSGHPLASKAIVSAEDVLAFPFVAYTRHPPRALHPMLAARQPTDARNPGLPFPAIECSSLAAAKRVVAASDAITPLTLPFVAKDLANGELTLLGSEPWMFAHYAMVSLKGRVPTAPHEGFRTCLRDAEAALSAEESPLAGLYQPHSRSAAVR